MGLKNYKPVYYIPSKSPSIEVGLKTLDPAKLTSKSHPGNGAVRLTGEILDRHPRIIWKIALEVKFGSEVRWLVQLW